MWTQSYGHYIILHWTKIKTETERRKLKPLTLVQNGPKLYDIRQPGENIQVEGGYKGMYEVCVL